MFCTYCGTQAGEATVCRNCGQALVISSSIERALVPSGGDALLASSGRNLVEPLPERLENALAELLHPGERILIKLKGAFKEGLVCTDQRVMIIKGGFMTGQAFGTNAFQIPYCNVAGVEVKFHLLTGYFQISAGGMQNQPKHYWSNNRSTDPAKAPNCISLNRSSHATAFREACSFILSKANESGLSIGASKSIRQTESHSDIASLIEQLARLRDGGLISVEEFQVKKTDLLNRL